MTTEANQEPVDNDEELGSLFNEITNGNTDFSKEDSEDVEDSLGSVEDDKQETETEDDASDDVQASQGDSGEDKGDDKDSEPAAQPEATENPETDIWSGASEAQRNAFRNLQHERLKLENDVKANAGRVQGYARKLNEVQAELEKLRQQQAQPQQQANAGQDVQLDGKSLQEVEEEYPEIAQYIRSQTQRVVQQLRQEIDPIKQTTSQLSGSVEEMSSERQQRVIQSELDRLSAAHPDYVDIRTHQHFHQWLRSKPQSIQSLANSMSADDNIELLNLYKSQTAAQQPRESERPVEPAPAQKKSDLSEHAEIPRKGAAPPQGLPEDPEELFNLITSKS